MTAAALSEINEAVMQGGGCTNRDVIHEMQLVDKDKGTEQQNNE